RERNGFGREYRTAGRVRSAVRGETGAAGDPSHRSPAAENESGRPANTRGTDRGPSRPNRIGPARAPGSHYRGAPPSGQKSGDGFGFPPLGVHPTSRSSRSPTYWLSRSHCRGPARVFNSAFRTPRSAPRLRLDHQGFGVADREHFVERRGTLKYFHN